MRTLKRSLLILIFLHIQAYAYVHLHHVHDKSGSDVVISVHPLLPPHIESTFSTGDEHHHGAHHHTMVSIAYSRVERHKPVPIFADIQFAETVLLLYTPEKRCSVESESMHSETETTFPHWRRAPPFFA